MLPAFTQRSPSVRPSVHPSVMCSGVHATTECAMSTKHRNVSTRLLHLVVVCSPDPRKPNTSRCDAISLAFWAMKRPKLRNFKTPYLRM